MKRILLSGFLSIVSLVAIAQIENTIPTAFQGAEGFGRFASGGRGGQVIYVTNLNDSGAGSLRAAIQATGPRIVMFKVSGTISLNSNLTINNDNITIAGQTAPGQGICLKNYSMVVNANNVIIRYIRSRMGDEANHEGDAMSGTGKSNIIIDHCSLSWSTDECGSFYNNTNFTLQWSILSESLRVSVHGKGTHGYGGIWGGHGASFHHNLLAHHDSRNPRMNGSRYTGNPDIEKVDFRNNVVYNWGGNSGYAGEGGTYNFVNNYYRYGPATSSSKRYQIFQPDPDNGANSNVAGTHGTFYVSGNYVYGSTTVTNDNWQGINPTGGLTDADVKSDTEYNKGQITTHTAALAQEKVLNYAGASLYRDVIDSRIVGEVEDGSYTYLGSSTGATKPGLIDTQIDVGGWPTYTSTTAPTDSDNDGMPDTWEDANGLDKNNANDGKGYDLSERFTNVELYINGLVESITTVQLDGGTANYVDGVAEPGEVTNATITWPFSTGGAGQTANYSGTTINQFKPDHVSLGSNLFFVDTRTTYGITYTRIQPVSQTGSGPTNVVAFNIWPKAGLTFVPTSISLDAQRYGTDSGLIDLVWRSSNGSSSVIGTGLVPARDNSGAGSHWVYDLSSLSIPSSDGECTLQVIIYNLGNTKQVGLANVTIEGNLSGTVQEVPTYTLTKQVSPEASGTIASSPVGSVFDEGTEITLTASRNFGFVFSHWEDGANQEVSTANPYTITLNENITLIAVFDPINTYSLDVALEGGAKEYMLTYAPSGTTVDNQRRYEEGTQVSISAKNNPILSFSNWSTGATTADLPLTMNENKSITATYSAVDYVAGWDFHKAGNAGRVADFASTPDNESSALVLRKADGTTAAWLDKSQVAAGGYEGAPAAVNWRAFADQFYYQISLTAAEFTDLVVQADMLYNYNAYSVQRCEYSLDGTNFSLLGTYTMTTEKVWYTNSFELPTDANNAERVYIRWIPDYTSAVLGTTSPNDGTSISAIYVTGTEAIVNDGIAPVLVSTVPANNGVDASASGKVVLNFDEKIQIAESATASLGTKTLTPIVSGKTISFDYNGLEYNTSYTFTLESGLVSDLSGNTLQDAVVVNFTTLNKPTVTKKAFDFIVGVDGTFAAALSAAQAASSGGQRFVIFFPNGEYDLGNTTGDGTQQTSIGIPNVSYIGESADGVILYNNPLPINEGIGTTPTINLLSTSNNIYMQDVTILNKMDYRSGSFLGRAVALRDQGDRNIYKNVRLLSNQDTYYTGAGRAYWEHGEIHGTVDFIFGGGDVFFNETLLYLEDRANNHLTAAATSGNWGYVFNNCIIDGFAQNNGSYKLGRPWQNSPKTVFLNTTMKVLPSAEGWSEWNVHPSVYAEYNSLTSSGSTVDLSNRRTSYSNGSTTVTRNPVLTSEQAADYTLPNVVGGGDNWNPRLYTEQAEVPVISLSGSQLTWDNNDYVLGWAIFKNGIFHDFVTTNSYQVSGNPFTTYRIRAANSMGGLSAASNEVIIEKQPTLITWSNPDDMVEGTALGVQQLNATANGNSSTPAYTPPSGTILALGLHDLGVFYAEDENYMSANATVQVLIVPEVTLGIKDDLTQIYPIPVVNNQLIVKLATANARLIIMDLNGRTVYQMELNNTLNEINLASLKSGLYMLKVIQGDVETVRKIIK